MFGARPKVYMSSSTSLRTWLRLVLRRSSGPRVALQGSRSAPLCAASCAASGPAGEKGWSGDSGGAPR
eukprot:5961679-Alexandrium_andersonii.AAC.1